LLAKCGDSEKEFEDENRSAGLGVARDTLIAADASL
jgi:hypothetical protein